LVFGGVLHAANEQALWRLWGTHNENPDDHMGTIKACMDYVRANPNDPLVPVAQSLAGWHYLKLGETEKGIALLEPLITKTKEAPGQGANQLARNWMSRVDREAVKVALQVYYRQKVQYPANLQFLAENPKVNTTCTYREKDRWDRPWRYRPTGLKGIPGFEGQSFILESSRLNSSSILTEALELPYATKSPLVPLRVMSTGNGTQMIQFKSAEGENQEVLGISVGQGNKELFVAYVGNNIVVVCDENHWILFLKPGRE